MIKPAKYRWKTGVDPKKDGEYIATVEVHHAFANGRYVDIVKFETKYGWSLKSNDYKVVAWHSKPQPWKGEATT